jgi:hypothetical protein
VPLFRERYDVALCRRDYFGPPLQNLLGFGRTPAFAEELGGYEIAGVGQLHHNGP